VRQLFLRSAVIAAAAILGACATLSPASRIQSQLVDLGISKSRASCIADELSDRLDRSDLNEVADFLDDINAAESAGGTIDRLAAIDNTRAAAAVAASAITCALGG